jgi:hypothetical protein
MAAVSAVSRADYWGVRMADKMVDAWVERRAGLMDTQTVY